MVTEAVEWAVPARKPPAIMLTSAVAARLAGPRAADFHDLPAFVVGEATARAAREAGFVDVRAGGGTVSAVFRAVIAAEFAEILHLAGEDRAAAVVPAGLSVLVCPVYRARLLPLAAVPAVDWVLLYSPRSAAHFADEVDRLGQPRDGLAIAAISAATLAAAGPGWRATAVAATPDEDALLAALGLAAAGLATGGISCQ
jgi:uroporphyrinogen-III synthase